MSSATEKKPNAWILHCKQYAKDNNLSYKEAVKNARATYVKAEKPTKIKVVKAPKVIEADSPIVIPYNKNEAKIKRTKLIKQIQKDANLVSDEEEELIEIEIMPVKKPRKTKKDIILQ